MRQEDIPECKEDRTEGIGQFGQNYRRANKMGRRG